MKGPFFILAVFEADKELELTILPILIAIFGNCLQFAISL